MPQRNITTSYACKPIKYFHLLFSKSLTLDNLHNIKMSVPFCDVERSVQKPIAHS